MASWLEIPHVEAASPLDPAEIISLAVSPIFVDLYSAIMRRSPIFQAWCHLAGSLPPINNISKVANSQPSPTTCTLKDALACFQGVNRPYVDEPTGDSVFVYVLTPRVSIIYEPSMVCVAKAVRVPKHSVLTVQATLTRKALSRRSMRSGRKTC